MPTETWHSGDPAVVIGIFAWIFGYPRLAIALFVVALLCIAFFRDPARRSAAPADAVLAPADGKVLSVGSAPAVPAGLGLPQQLSIFMSPADVHVNRAPIAGTVREASWRPGRKFPAYRAKASELNEHSSVVIDGAAGTIAYKQNAGSLARRGVCGLRRASARPLDCRVGRRPPDHCHLSCNVEATNSLIAFSASACA